MRDISKLTNNNNTSILFHSYYEFYLCFTFEKKVVGILFPYSARIHGLKACAQK